MDQVLLPHFLVEKITLIFEVLKQIVALKVEAERHDWVLLDHQHDGCGQPLDEHLVLAFLGVVNVMAWHFLSVPYIVHILKGWSPERMILTSFMWMSLKIFMKESIS